MTALTPNELDRIVDEHYRAEATMDLPAILATYTDDIVFDFAGSPDVLRGRKAAEAFYRQLFGDLLTEKVTPLRRLHGGNFIVDDAIFECRAIGAPFGLPGGNRPVKFRLMHVFEVRDGRICRETAWLDLAAIREQLGAEPGQPGGTGS